MKKIISSAVIILAAIVFLTATDSFAQSVPKVKVSLAKKSYKAGQTGTLIIKFIHGNDIKIPKEPEIEVSLSGVSGIGLQPIGGGEYLSPSQIKYNFTVPSDAQSGSQITISGSVKFGYCNSETGVCKIGNKSFTVKLKVK
jgi:ABC-type Fe3+-hydroxamate transport system substrate-binding protein